MPSFLHRLSILMLLALLVAGCTPDTEVSTDLPEQPHLRMLTEDRARAFAQQVVADVNAGDGRMLDSAFDAKSWANRVSYGLENPALKPMVDSVAGMVRLGNIMVTMRAACADLSLINVDWGGGQPRAIYRAITQNNGFNHIELVLGEDRGGNPTVLDFFSHYDIDPFSVRVRRILSWRVSIVDAMFGRGAMGLGQALDSISGLWKDGRYRDLLAFGESLPEPLKSDRYLVPMRLASAQHVSDSVWMNALEDVHERFAGNRSMSILMLDYFLKKKQYDSAMIALNGLDNDIGGDPYLSVLRAGIKITTGDYDKARMYAYRAISKDSSMTGAYIVLLEVAIFERRFIEATQITGQIHERFGVLMTPDMLRADADLGPRPELKEYLASKELAAFSAANHESN